MAVFFRALVMLLTLVGLPAAWVYYGPLPKNAQRVADRFVEVARDAIGWSTPLPAETAQSQTKSAPRFDEVLPTQSELTSVSRATFEGSKAPVQLASAREAIPSLPQLEPSPGMNDEMQMHLSLLKKLGAAEYSLEKWGDGYRFKCEIPLGDNVDFTQHFEAIAAEPLVTVRQVVGEVTSWQNARHDPSGTVWR
jgi:hypothetical protein